MLALLLVFLITVLIMGGIAGFVLLVTNLPSRTPRRGFGWIGGPVHRPGMPEIQVAVTPAVRAVAAEAVAVVAGAAAVVVAADVAAAAVPDSTGSPHAVSDSPLVGVADSE